MNINTCVSAHVAEHIQSMHIHMNKYIEEFKFKYNTLQTKGMSFYLRNADFGYFPQK